MQAVVVKTGLGRSKAILFGAAMLGLTAVSGCSGNTPPATNAPSGITSSNGGGMRATGAIPDVGVSNGVATTGTMPRNPRVPTY